MERYSRQVRMPDIGEDGQEKLRRAKVVVIGTGGLGSPILMYLVAAGIGHVRFVDCDVVDISNLNRQILHTTPNVGVRKTRSALEALRALNPDITIEPVDAKFTPENAHDLLRGMDYIIDASDNFDAKFLVNDTAVHLGIPCTIGGVIRWDGQMLSVDPGRSACYRCVFGEKPSGGMMKSPSELGIIGVTAGLLGVIAASECLKYLLGFGHKDRLVNRLLMVDLHTLEFTSITLQRAPRCKACSTGQEQVF
nr:HesA/MoeB/ThiF family protein [Candidatus Sigynarchaeota archaeon]